jgi:plasmid stabilization system protein ParE
VTYHVEPTETAIREAAEAYEWLRARTELHAPEWLAGLEDAIQSLTERPARCPLAPEAEETGEEIRQLLYGSRAHAYRILYVVRGRTAHVLHIRHGARRHMSRREIEMPPNDE